MPDEQKPKAKPVTHAKSGTGDVVREYMATILIASLAMSAGTAWSKALARVFGAVGESNTTGKMIMVAITATIFAALAALYFSNNDEAEEREAAKIASG